MFGFFLIAVAGCGYPTTYGKSPKRDVLDRDLFAFTIYFNAYTSSLDIDLKAKEEIKKIMDERGYKDFAVQNIECGSFMSRCTYQVKFYASTSESKASKSGPREGSTALQPKGKPQVSSGTGFLVAQSGYVVTNWHIVGESSDVVVYIQFAQKNFVASVAVHDVHHDLAILKLEGFDYDSLYESTIPYEFGSTKRGQEVYTLGFPLREIMGNTARLSIGTVNSLYGIQDDPRLIQISNPLQPGNSGGPLLNTYGDLVGVVVASLNAKLFYENLDILPQNVNFAVKSVYLTNLILLLPENEIELERINLLQGKSLEKQVELVTPFVYQVISK